MEYAYATCILNETGEEINEQNLTAVLEAAGCSVIESRVKAIIAALEDVDVSEVTAVDVEDTSNASPQDQEIQSTADRNETADRDETADRNETADRDETADQDETADGDVTANGDGTGTTSGTEPATEAETSLVSVEQNGESGASAEAANAEPSEER